MDRAPLPPLPRPVRRLRSPPGALAARPSIARFASGKVGCDRSADECRRKGARAGSAAREVPDFRPERYTIEENAVTRRMATKRTVSPCTASVHPDAPDAPEV